MYRSLTAFLVLALLASCNQIQESRFQLPSEKDVHAIIKTVILEDNIPVLLKREDFYPLSSELIEFKISLSESDMPIYLPGEGIRMKVLLEVKADSLGASFLFSLRDSAYFMFLNDNWLRESHSISKLGAAGIKVIPSVKLRERVLKEEGKTSAYYIFSNPIFSEDHTKAYVELTFACDRLCGGGRYYCLVKNGHEWKVVNRGQTYFE